MTEQGQSSLEERSLNNSSRENNPSVLLTRTTMNQFTRNALRSLVESEMLAEFWTTFTWNPKSRWNRLLPQRLRTHLARRHVSEAPAHLVRSVPWREVVRLTVRGTPLKSLFSSGERPFSDIGIGRKFDATVACRVPALRPDIVYAYEGAALRTFREARKQGITTILEQPTAYWKWERELFLEEAERNPEFATLLPNLGNSPAHHAWKEEELRLADYVFVPSQHVLETLRGVIADEKIRVISYGAPPDRGKKPVSLDANRPLKVLFAGSLTQRKGIGYLLNAIAMLGSQVEFTMVGRKVSHHPRVDDACKRYRWIETAPHSQVLEIMRGSDVLALPSLTEAFGLVATEAMACGLPVIVTPNTGAGEIMRDGHEGFIVPICSADAIAARLETLHRDRDMLATMSRQAQVTAAEHSWANYRVNWADAVRSLACQKR